MLISLQITIKLNNVNSIRFECATPRNLITVIGFTFWFSIELQCGCVCKVSGMVKAIALHIYSHIVLITAGVSKHEHVARAFVRLYLSCCDVCSRFRFISWIRIHNNLFPFRYRKYKFVLELLLLRFIYSSQPQFIQYICEFAFRFVFHLVWTIPSGETYHPNWERAFIIVSLLYISFNQKLGHIQPSLIYRIASHEIQNIYFDCIEKKILSKKLRAWYIKDNNL